MYNRKEAEKILIKKYGFEPTGEKHEESYFTRWHMNYYLFEKFGIDKRKAHYSSLIVSGQMTRKEAMEKLQENPIYPQIGLEHIVHKYKPRPYTDFKTDEKWYNLIRKIIKCLF